MTIEQNMVNDATPKIKNKHPQALPILFLTEMWERFGFYVVEGFLVLYLTGAFGFSDEKSYAILGAFTSFVFITPVIGGYIADKILGFKTSIIIGAILLFAGYGLLAIGKLYLYPALAIIIAGNGFFKPNIASLLGTLYEENDPRRESGFTIFYMGINTGGMFATLISGYVKDHFGWQAGFALASIGLLIGLITFIFGLKTLKEHGHISKNNEGQSLIIKILHNKFIMAFCTLFSIILFAFLIQYQVIADTLLIITSLLILFGLFFSAYKNRGIEGNRILVLTFLMLSSIVFWAVFFQMWYSVNLFIDRDIDKVVLGYHIPTVMFLSLEPFFIIVTGPILARIWQALNRKGNNISTPFKFVLAMFAIAVGFVVLAASTYSHNSLGLINPLWIVVAYFFVTLAEMLLSPIGMSAVTTLSPPKLVGMMMGVWYIAIGFGGGKLAGVIADFSSIPNHIKDPMVISHIYGHAFMLYTGFAIIMGIIMLIFNSKLTRMMNRSI